MECGCEISLPTTAARVCDCLFIHLRIAELLIAKPPRARRPVHQVSEIDLRVGLVPGLPMALKGTVVTKARLNPTR